MDSDGAPEFDEVISDGTTSEGKFSCPICGDYAADDVRQVQGHISGSKDEVHADLGRNYEAEIKATAEHP